jgi:hypothetical protein
MNPSSSPMLPALSSTLFISLLDSARQLQISDTCTVYTFVMSSFIELLKGKTIISTSQTRKKRIKKSKKPF